MNPAKPSLPVNALEASAPSQEIELRDKLRFKEETHRLDFKTYMETGGGTPEGPFLELIYGGPGTVANIDVSDFTKWPDRKHILVSETSAFFIYRLIDYGGLPADNHPTVVLPAVAVGTRYWELAFAFDYATFTLLTWGRHLDLNGGSLMNASSLNFQTDDHRRNAFKRLVQWEDDITTYTGGTPDALDGIPTLNVNPTIVVEFRHPSHGLRKYRLRFGNDAHNPPNIIRPADFSAFNEKVWETLF